MLSKCCVKLSQSFGREIMCYPPGGTETSGKAKEMSDDVWLVLVLNGFGVCESVLLRWWSWFSMASPRALEYCVMS